MRTVLFAKVVLLVSVFGFAGCKSTESGDALDADGTFESFLVAFERGNVSLIRPLLSDDVLVTAPDGTAHEGKDAVLAAFEKAFASMGERKRHRAQQTTHEDDIAAQIGFFDDKKERSDGRVETTASGTYVLTLLRGDDGRWKVQNFEWSNG